MEIPFVEDPKENLLEFKRMKRQGTLEPIHSGYNSCRHKYTLIDQEHREVTCRDCAAKLDPFQVLLDLANKQRQVLDEIEAWEARQESLLSERYDEIWLRHAGDIKEPPPEDAEERKVWEIFSAYFGDKFTGMYRIKKGKRSGMTWYGRSCTGSCVSLVYARSQLSPRLIAPEVKANAIFKLE